MGLLCGKDQKGISAWFSQSRALTFLFLQQLEAIDDKPQIDSQAFSLEPGAQHGVLPLKMSAQKNSLSPAAI